LTEVCGCFYCLERFTPNEIEEWIDDENGEKALATALCPKCGMDSVLGNAAFFDEIGTLKRSFLFRVT